MDPLTIRNFTPADIPAITALQQAYQQVYPHAPVIPGEVYCSPGFQDGQNIFCAFDDAGSLQGYAPLLPVLTESVELPHIVWAEVKARPESNVYAEVKAALFEQVICRAKEASAAVPGHAVHLTFQYHPTETASIDDVTRCGGAYTESLYRLMRSLSEALPMMTAPEGIEVRRWHMDSDAEQQAYVRARNECFPETPVALADWQSFMASPAWKEGTNITAFDGSEVVGGVTAYWDELISQMTGCEAAYTEYIFVRPAWRGRRVAGCLITEALAYLKEKGREAAFLEVKASNTRALELYLRLGYKLVDETRFYVVAI